MPGTTLLPQSRRRSTHPQLPIFFFDSRLVSFSSSSSPPSAIPTNAAFLCYTRQQALPSVLGTLGPAPAREPLQMRNSEESSKPPTRPLFVREVRGPVLPARAWCDLLDTPAFGIRNIGGPGAGFDQSRYPMGESVRRLCVMTL